MLVSLRRFIASPSQWLRVAVEHYPFRGRAMAVEWSRASMMDDYDYRF
jgi:hypothetical protein